MKKWLILRGLPRWEFPIFLSGFLNGLFDDGKITYDGPDQVEFKPLSETATLSANQTASISVAVQLIGEQRNQDITVNFSVVDTDAENAAQEGVPYTISTTSVTIAANTSSATFDINLMGENLAAGEAVQLALELQENPDQDIEVAENLKRYELRLQGGG